MAKKRIAVIGTGYLGKLHARVLSEMPNIEFVGFVERDDTAAAEIMEKHQAKRFGSVEAIAPHIDGAVIATPTISHFDVATTLIDAGCDLMIEKPITSTIEDAEK